MQSCLDNKVSLLSTLGQVVGGFSGKSYCKNSKKSGKNVTKSPNSNFWVKIRISVFSGKNVLQICPSVLSYLQYLRKQVLVGKVILLFYNYEVIQAVNPTIWNVMWAPPSFAYTSTSVRVIPFSRIIRTAKSRCYFTCYYYRVRKRNSYTLNFRAISKRFLKNDLEMSKKPAKL